MPPVDDFYLHSIRRLLLVVIFCALLAAAVLEATYRLPFPIEIRAYGAGMRHGYPIHLLAVFGTHLGRSMLAFRIPLLAAVAVLAVLLIWVAVPERASLRVLLYGTAALLTVIGLLMVHEAGALRSQRHAFFALRNCLEASAAPEEAIIVEDDSLQGQLGWYLPPEQRRQTELNVPSPETSGEFLYIGTGQANFVTSMSRRGYVFRDSQCISPDEGHALGGLLQSADIRLYFVTHNATAVSSNP